uniref:lathosterol oxidase isoform X1 n=1 Tax=Myxine glutinosa TaxID=7769 RepID=UPI00358E22C6
MDIVLRVADDYVLTPHVYPAYWMEDDAVRQFLSLFVISIISGMILYLGCGLISYQLIFDHNTMNDKLFLKNQVYREISDSLRSIPWMAAPTALLFLAEVRGYSKLHEKFDFSAFEWLCFASSAVTFILFTDMCIYWIHRGLHHKDVYQTFHKLHHTWIIPSPFASHAFHPVDGFLQGFPYHLYVFLFPLHKVLYLMLYLAVNIWTVSIHDGARAVPKPLACIVNGAAHHAAHHRYFDCNYGQYLTFWDKVGGSYRKPDEEHKNE